MRTLRYLMIAVLLQSVLGPQVASGKTYMRCVRISQITYEADGVGVQVWGDWAWDKGNEKSLVFGMLRFDRNCSDCGDGLTAMQGAMEAARPIVVLYHPELPVCTWQPSDACGVWGLTCMAPGAAVENCYPENDRNVFSDPWISVIGPDHPMYDNLCGELLKETTDPGVSNPKPVPDGPKIPDDAGTAPDAPREESPPSTPADQAPGGSTPAISSPQSATPTEASENAAPVHSLRGAGCQIELRRAGSESCVWLLAAILLLLVACRRRPPVVDSVR